MTFKIGLAFLAVALLPAAEPLFETVDLDAGTARKVQVGGKTVEVKLLSTSEERDSARSAVRLARAEVEIDGVRATLECGNYRLPVLVGGVQADCAVTKAYYSNSNRDHWGLANDARLRLWPAGSPWMPPGSYGYPARQRWFATRTQMANEPTYVDGGERYGKTRVYYHAGLDIGGAEALDEVVAATDGTVVGIGKQQLDAHVDAIGKPRFNDTIWVLDERGWYHRYTHLHSFHTSVELGKPVKKGQVIGLLGKEGSSGGWAHLHYEIIGRQPSGKFGTVEGYAFLWEAWQRESKPDILAVARPHVLVLTGQPARLDGSRSWSRDGKIVRYEWTFSDGGTASGPTATRVYKQPGNYSEILKVTDSRGRVAWDFITVGVVDPERPKEMAPAVHAAYHPTTGIKAGQPVTFLARTFETTDNEEVWDFGDGTPPAKTRSDGNVNRYAKDGYATIKHAFARPGDYIVRVSRTNAKGFKGLAHLHVKVGR